MVVESGSVTLVPGRMVGETLRLSRLLGRGAMGSVWVADHLSLRSQVAVKFMAQAMLDDATSLRRFQQEAMAAAEIRSPHVVRVFDHGTTEDGLPYIVMELLEGESLERRLKRAGPMAVADAVAVVRQCAKALAKAHEKGIFHRDIKPGNIFLSSEDELFVKVVDFGVAKFSGQEAIEMTAQGNMVGTPAYMSPEQLFHGKSIDHRGDLWSLAVVAYQSMTGERPFDGVTLGELCFAIKRGEFEKPSKLRAGLPPELDAWFERAFAHVIDARFQSARELSSALDVATGNITTSTPSLAGPVAAVATFPGGTAVPSVSAGVRSRWLPVGAAVLAAFGCVAGAVALFSSRPGATGSSPGTPATVESAATQAPSGQAPSAPRDGANGPPSATVVSAADSAVTPGPAPSAQSGSVPAPLRPTLGGAKSNAIPSSAPMPSGPRGPEDSDERSKRAGEQLGI